MKPEQLLRDMFEVAVRTAHPAQCLPPHLPAPPKGRTIVVGAGKAAAAMALAVEQHWQGPLEQLSGLVITRYGHGEPCNHIEVIEAGHPIPDAQGQAAAEQLLQRVTGLTADDLVLCLISGGGSALLSLPPDTVPLTDKQTVTNALLRSGATIHEINCVRKHLSRIKGGRLGLAAYPARVVTLMISDVPGDDLSVIASGPTVADPSTRFEALEILARYGINAPASVLQWLHHPASETPKPTVASLTHVENRLIATPMASLHAAAQLAQQHGIRTVILGDDLEGEARAVAALHAGLAQQCLIASEPAAPPCVLISGGETTVTVRGAGRGGRNAEFLLALLIHLHEQADTWAIACDTDGIDGTEDNAGALIGPRTASLAQRQGLDANQFLDNNDAHTFFARLGLLINTGPTRTNINDFRAVFIGRRS